MTKSVGEFTYHPSSSYLPTIEKEKENVDLSIFIIEFQNPIQFESFTVYTNPLLAKKIKE